MQSVLRVTASRQHGYGHFEGLYFDSIRHINKQYGSSEDLSRESMRGTVVDLRRISTELVDLRDPLEGFD